MTLLYWQIGDRIQREILQEKRAEYGAEILLSLSLELEVEFGSGFGEKNLRRMVQFAEIFPDREIVVSLIRQLTWTHFIALIPLKDPLQREFYAEMCRIERWSVRTLRSRVGSMLYERTALSKKPAKLIEQERQVVIELKIGDFKPADAGQIELYLRWLDRHERQEGEEKPIGLILCAGKKRETVEVLELEPRGIHVSEYLTELPPRELLEQRLHEAVVRARLSLEQRGTDEALASP